jgi:hypothetical protein
MLLLVDEAQAIAPLGAALEQGLDFSDDRMGARFGHGTLLQVQK